MSEVRNNSAIFCPLPLAGDVGPFFVKLFNYLFKKQMSTEDRYVFVAELYDQMAALIRKYHIAWYLSDNTIDIVKN